jgi:PIN domain nuclease of toxin-antitoxin system
VIVLDSSALLAMLFFESGCERVAELVPQSCMSTVNLAEVLGRLARDGRALDEVLDRIEQMGVDLIAFDREMAREVAALLLPTAPWGLSLGDRACLALARLRRLPAVTADRAWANLDLDIAVEVIR